MNSIILRMPHGQASNSPHKIRERKEKEPQNEFAHCNHHRLIHLPGSVLVRNKME